MPLTLPSRLAANCAKTAEGTAWLGHLPSALRELSDRWAISMGEPFDSGEVSCSWVAPVVRRDGAPAILKLGLPHMEGEHEIQGLRFWNGRPTVRLLEADPDLNAMLLERCGPGTPLRELPEFEQDVVIANLLVVLWRLPPPPHPFRPLSAQMRNWSEQTLRHEKRWFDPELVREGMRLFTELSQTATREVLLATDLHAGNVLRARREPWLVIDPKPFIGDPAYDATQHLLNCPNRLCGDPYSTICRFADLAGVDRERVRLWLLARAAAEPRESWINDRLTTLARAISRLQVA